MYRSVAALTIIATLSTASTACHCDGPTLEPSAHDITEAATETPTPAEPGASPEVLALVEVGDATAIAADMERLAAVLSTQAAATGDAARSLEQVAEGMTGRKKSLDPRNAGDVALMEESAASLSSGSAELEQDIASLRQIVLDLQAEANALYGRPTP